MAERSDSEWRSGEAGKIYPGRIEKKKAESGKSAVRVAPESAAGDAPRDKKDKKSKEDPIAEPAKGKKGKDEPVKKTLEERKEEWRERRREKKIEDEKKAQEEYYRKQGKLEKMLDVRTKSGKTRDMKANLAQKAGVQKTKTIRLIDPKQKHAQATSSPRTRLTTIPEKAQQRGKKKDEPPEIDEDEVSLSPSERARQEAEQRALQRKRNLCRRPWPVVTKVKLVLKPWKPPGPPEKPPKAIVELPPLETRQWIPPWMRRRKPRPKLPKMLPPPTTELPACVGSTLKKVWHAFEQVDTNKMMLRGTNGCNSKRYSSTTCGAQTGCIAFIARALLDEKTPAQLLKKDVDDVIEAGDQLYRQCIKSMKCYKGKPALELKQILPQFYFHDWKYSVVLNEEERGILAKHPDNLEAGPDMLGIMEKYVGKNYMFILTVGRDRHFLIWGHPPEDAGTNVKTICYIFDPHMMDDYGVYNPVGYGVESCGCGPFPGGGGAGAILRYPGVTSFVMDFLGNYCNLDEAKKPKPKPPITLTSIEIAGKEPIFRWPGYDLDIKSLKPHCKSEWDAMNINAMIDDKRYRGKYPFGSLSDENLSIRRRKSRYKTKAFFQKLPKEPPPPTLPVPPEKPPPQPPLESLNQYKGEDFFLYCPRVDAHTFGRDDLIPLAKSDPAIHSLYEKADKSFESQFERIKDGVDAWILRGTRHFASYRYQLFLWYHGVAACVAALAMLRKLRARGWNEDTIDETCDVGWNLHRESLMERRGPIRRLVLGELKKEFTMRDKQYEHKERGIAVWGKLLSKNPKVFDICRGIEEFFKTSDSGILQIPGEYETAIWYEGGRYYMYHPWPADRYGMRVSLQGGGKACLLAFGNMQLLCEHFMENVKDMKKKPYSISDVGVYDLGERPEPVNNMKAVGPNRWIVRGTFHEGDERFPEEHRNKQATPTAITAIAMASLVNPAGWTPADIDEILMRGDTLYDKTLKNLDKMGINLEHPPRIEADNEGEEEEAVSLGTSGTLAAADVLPRFNISEYDSIETDVLDAEYSGQLSAQPGSNVMSLKDSLKELFKDHNAGVVTARGGSVAVWKHDDHFYFFDPHGCDEYGLPSDEPLSGACLLRMDKNYKELADVIMGNLAPGSDDSFNISPVEITTAKLNPELGAPEIKKEGRQFEWLNKNTATILMGPRGENTAIGKAAKKCQVPKTDLAGRDIALPVVAAFAAATEAVQPPGMHQDHMFNFLEAGGEYYLNHVKNKGKKEIGIEDLNEKYEMGVNTFSLEIDEPTRLPLRLPDAPAEGGGDEEEQEPVVLGEDEEPPPPPLKQMKELLFKYWYDNTKPAHVFLMTGAYHILGVWLTPGGKVVCFDPEPTLAKGLLTPHRIKIGDEIRKKRLKEENPPEGEEEEDDEGGGEEAEPEVEQFVPPESCPVLMIFASPAEFIDKLVSKGGLTPTQAIAPYWLYPVKITNELTSLLKEKKSPSHPDGEEGAGDAAGTEAEEEALVEPLSDEAMGKYFKRNSRTVASMRGQVAQNEVYFMDRPNRDNQDPAVAVMGIVVHHIEPYIHWKPSLVDAILKYGDRLYTLSIPNAKNPPRLEPEEIIKEFHVTAFIVKVDIEGEVVNGDYKAGETGNLLNLKRGLKKFFENYEYGVICAKNYCIGVWKAADDKAYVYWDPHTVGPIGKFSPASAAGVILFSTLDELADTFKKNLANLNRPGTNKYTIASVKVTWEFEPVQQHVNPPGAVQDEGYEFKVLTAYVEVGRGRTILRGTPPVDLQKFCRDSLIASAPTAIVAAAMAHVRKPHLWTRKTVDEVMNNGCQLFQKSISNLGYEFRPGDDILLPLQVPKRFILGTNFIQYDLPCIYTGKLEQGHHKDMTCKSALEKFFHMYNIGVLWCAPHAVAVWKVPGSPGYFMMEPHACGPDGLRTSAKEDGAACVMTFTSPKLLAHTYLSNLSPPDRYKRHFALYAVIISVVPIKPVGRFDPPLVRPVKGLPKGTKVVPATSKVDFYGQPRRADELSRAHPPGDDTWADAVRAMNERDKLEKLRGIRNSNGWLVLSDGSQFLSAAHSMACRRYPFASRGNQALAMSVMAVAMSAVEEVCRWCNTTLDQILDSGDQLYQDSYLHYHPNDTPILAIEQILRKFYTPGNCACRVVVYKPRQMGFIGDEDLNEKIRQFFREERSGVFVAYGGEFAVALFKTPRGFYMFDPADRDRYGRAVPPLLNGRARACFSQWPTINALADQLKANIGPPMRPPPKFEDPDAPAPVERTEKTPSQPDTLPRKDSTVRFKDQIPPPKRWDTYALYGIGVTRLRRLYPYET